MANVDWLTLSDPKLEDDYNRAAFDPTRARKPIIATLDKAAEQFAKLPEKTKGRKIWSISNTTVKVTLPFEAKGTAVHYFPSEHFPDVIASMKKDIEAGKYDAAIEAGAGESAGSTSRAETGTRRKRQPMTQEQKDARRKRMEAAGTFGKGGRAKAS